MEIWSLTMAGWMIGCSIVALMKKEFNEEIMINQLIGITFGYFIAGGFG